MTFRPVGISSDSVIALASGNDEIVLPLRPPDMCVTSLPYDSYKCVRNALTGLGFMIWVAAFEGRNRREKTMTSPTANTVGA